MLNQVLGRCSTYLALFTVCAGALMVSSLAVAQIKPIKPVATIQSSGLESLSLSFTQMQALENVVEAHQASFEALLTPAQLTRLNALRANYQDAPTLNPDVDPIDQLHLSPAQQDELTALRTLLMAQFEAILTLQQLQQLETMGLIVPIGEGQ
ncbi:hypothetical protein IQ254_30460 [Nodosilinea sp. LEGE 07088]|uniref:hypothetical protein n=1 Tax=Nodosilinea sp. LEGE 07088 TaxID=2777968 RepID=UPI001882F40C|nr:hypothetical protein [Nodosilinea sp. LEGE 07088]MBE9141463.1 hypothetical protein [Nodosilinea sp. LEGE 07088]